MKLISWNVNGIRAIYRKNLFEFLEEHDPDILAIQETKARPQQLTKKLLNYGDYYKFFSSAEKKGYSGVTTFSKPEPKGVKYGFGYEKYDSEGRIVLTEYEDFSLFNIYFPNGKSRQERLDYKMDFYYDFLKFMNDYKKQQPNVIVCGDVNTAHKEIDLARPKDNETVSGFLPEEREWIDKFLDSGFYDSFRLFNKEPDNYSWWDYKTRARERNVGWRIDYFFVSEGLKNRLKKAEILNEVYGSDHCPIMIEI